MQAPWMCDCATESSPRQVALDQLCGTQAAELRVQPALDNAKQVLLQGPAQDMQHGCQLY